MIRLVTSLAILQALQYKEVLIVSLIKYQFENHCKAMEKAKLNVPTMIQPKINPLGMSLLLYRTTGRVFAELNQLKT